MIYYQPPQNSAYVQGHEWTVKYDASENQVSLLSESSWHVYHPKHIMSANLHFTKKKKKSVQNIEPETLRRTIVISWINLLGYNLVYCGCDWAEFVCNPQSFDFLTLQTNVWKAEESELNSKLPSCIWLLKKSHNFWAKLLPQWGLAMLYLKYYYVQNVILCICTGKRASCKSVFATCCDIWLFLKLHTSFA